MSQRDGKCSIRTNLRAAGSQTLASGEGRHRHVQSSGASQRHSLGSAIANYVVNGKELGNLASVLKNQEQTPDDITSHPYIPAKTSKGFNFF